MTVTYDASIGYLDSILNKSVHSTCRLIMDGLER